MGTIFEKLVKEVAPDVLTEMAERLQYKQGFFRLGKIQEANKSHFLRVQVWYLDGGKWLWVEVPMEEDMKPTFATALEAKLRVHADFTGRFELVENLTEGGNNPTSGS